MTFKGLFNKKKKASSSQVKESAKNSQNKSNTPKKIKRKKILKRFAIGFVFLMLTLFVIGLGYVFAIIKSTPPLDVNAVTNLSQPSQFVFRDGQFMTNIQTDEQRFIITSDQIPQNLKDAYVSIEDERFYKHSGVDVRRILGAAYNNIKMKLTGTGMLHGASTMTQQLLKNTILSNETTYERKIREAYLALQLEKQLSKDQILTHYLNTIPLGGTAYGVEAAAYLYFGKSASDLTLVQCAYLAGITQAPSTYSIYMEKNKKDPSRYINRTVTVLSKMLELGYITQEEHDAAVAEAKENKFSFSQTERKTSMDYQWVAYPALDQVKKDLKEKYKYTDEEINKLIVNGGLKIHTTVDKEIQDFTQATLDDYKNLNLRNKETFDEDGVPLPQAAATVMDPYTGEVIAIVGGRGKQKPKSYNRAYFGLRPIGSVAKPLTVYGPAINEKILTAGSALDDSPLNPEIGKLYPVEGGKPYSPNNWDNTYLGYITPRDAIRGSKNVTSVLTEHMIGIKTGLSYGEKLGLVYNSKSKTSLSALALGQFNNDPADRDGGNTTILASAFSSFVNKGDRTEARLYTKVEDATGKVLLESEPTTVNVWSPEVSYIMYDILKGPVYQAPFLASQAKFGNIPVAGKTGTTSEAKDLWFAGTTPYYSGSVWVGYDTPKDLLGGSGTSTAALWGKIMKKVHEGLAPKEIDVPSGLVKAEVCKDSGKAPTDLCKNDPRGNRVYTEYFVKGTEPTALCETHVKVKINKSNGKLATSNTPKDLIEERIMIKKDYISSVSQDYPYVVPKDTDDTVATPSEPEDNDGNNDNNSNNDDEDTDDKLIDLSSILNDTFLNKNTANIVVSEVKKKGINKILFEKDNKPFTDIDKLKTLKVKGFRIKGDKDITQLTPSDEITLILTN